MSVYLVSGIPGAGKSTFCRAFAGRFPRGVHVEGDVLSFEFVVSGLAEPFGSNADRAEWDRQMALRRQNMCLLADSFAGADFVPVMDDVVTDPSELHHHLQLLQQRPLYFIVLAPRLEVAAARDGGREASVLDVWGHLDAELRASLAGVGLWLDTSDMTVDEAIAAVIEREDEARLS